MATDKKPEGSTADQRAGGEQPKSSVSPQAVLTTPMIFQREKSQKERDGKTGKKRYTKGTKSFQRLILGTTKAGFRVSNSLSEGLNTFVKRSKKSARKKRDGLLRDSFYNASRGFADGMAELGKAPREIAARVGTGRVRRILRIFPIALG